MSRGWLPSIGGRRDFYSEFRTPHSRADALEDVGCKSPNSALDLRLIVFFPELVYAAFRVDQLLLARKERMANGADVQSYFRLR